MRDAGLYEVQAGMKIAGRNINNLRYGDDTTLVAESKELKSLLMKVEEESLLIMSKLLSSFISFMDSASCVLSVTASPRLWTYSLMLSDRFIILAFIFRSMIYLELNFIMDWTTTQLHSSHMLVK